MLEHAPKQVKVVEVGPRDGLQNESMHVSTQDKVALIEALGFSGLKNIEITSFVSPKWIPQLADGLEVAKSLRLPPDVVTSALVPNLKGYDAAVRAKLKQMSLFMSASESHSQKNINKSIDEALETLSEVAQAAKRDGHTVRCYVSVAFECPYEGVVSPERVARLTHRLVEMGVDEVSLGDTIGAARPNQVTQLIKLVATQLPLEKIALHFHDTRGMALANVIAGLDAGVGIYDASIGGMGGCPYAPGASGNLATEDLVYLLNGLGIESGININRLVDAAELAQEILGKKLPGRYLQTCLLGRKNEGTPEATAGAL